MATLLTGVKSKMYIFAHRRARGMLDGEYASVFRGRSLDFDDLRDYVPGDEVRDIDWKATARTGTPLIKRYVATRRQQLLFVADTGANMAAISRGGEFKKDLAVLAMGVLGLLATRHGDSVALVHGAGTSTSALPAKGTEGHLEQLLQHMDGASLAGGASDLCARLEYVAAHIKARTLLVVVADELAPGDRLASVLRRLRAQHEILWLEIADAVLTGPGALHSDAGTATDVAAPGTRLLLPARNSELARSYAAAAAERAAAMAGLLQSSGIAATGIGAADEVMNQVFALLERHRRAR